MKPNVLSLAVALALAASVHLAGAQPVITSFSQNGVLVCSNLYPGSAATVAWASTPAGPWQTDWATLSAVTVPSNGIIQLSVPMFYRVLEVPAALIPAGAFTMGDTLDGESDAIPTNIYVSAFYMDTTLVTYSQWQAVYSWAINNGYSFDGPGFGKAANHPAVGVDWYDCVKWCNARSQRAGLKPCYYTDAGLSVVAQTGYVGASYVDWSANGYRLPTEAEWEKAARGGLNGQRFPWGLTISESQANYGACTNCYTYDLGPYNGFNTNFVRGGQPYTSPVGYFAANGYGLYDMAGNVEEWCWDWYGTPYGQPSGSNPTGPASGGFRVLRGGGWGDDAIRSRCASRVNSGAGNAIGHVGFRCVRGH